MSSSFSLAAVTAVIKNQIDNGLIESNLNTTVSLLPPDKLNSAEENHNRLNLFLYRVTPNQGWANNNLPSMNSGGERISNPVLPLDLHYLITASGSSDYQSEILLGTAMNVLHNIPVLGRDAIRKTLNSTVQSNSITNWDEIKKSELDKQVEQIKLSLQNMNLDEISKLWSSFQTSYRLTVSYLATVVLVQNDLSVKSALPVTGRNVYAMPYNNPVIEQISTGGEINLPLAAGSRFIITGTNFPSENLKLIISDIDFSSSIEQADSNEVTVKFADSFPDNFFSGMHSLKITGPVDMGLPPSAHIAKESNSEALVIHPKINIGTSAFVNASSDGSLKNGKMKINFIPKVNTDEKITLFLNEFNASGTQPVHSYSFPAPVNNGITGSGTSSDVIEFNLSNVAAGTYLVRVRVDGADSLLEQETDQNSANYLKFIRPQIVI